MGCDPNRAPRGGVYRARNPRASALYQCADRRKEELRSEGRLQRLIEERVIERFLQCGDHADLSRCNARNEGAGSCEDILRWNQEVASILQLPEVRESLLKRGLVPTPSTPEEIAAQIKGDIDRWKRFIAETGIKAD